VCFTSISTSGRSNGQLIVGQAGFCTGLSEPKGMDDRMLMARLSFLGREGASVFISENISIDVNDVNVRCLVYLNCPVLSVRFTFSV
jgi:hypothetical protein